jgi:hypothetical protein
MLDSCKLILSLIGFSTMLSACSNLGGATLEAAKMAFFGEGKKSYETTPLDPRFAYLEVHTPDASALMVLGLVDQGKQGRVVETWLGANKEVLRTQSGLFQSSVGVPRLWDQSRLLHDAQGEVIGFQLDSSVLALHQTTVLLKPLEPRSLPNTNLARRVESAQSVFQKRWVTNINPSELAYLSGLDGLEQIVVFDSKTGVALYGRQCVSKDYCIEYLRRSAARNL